MVTLPIHLRAVFRDGKFVPQEPCALPESAEVQLTVEPTSSVPTQVTDPAERAKLLAEVVQRMMSQPLAADAPKLTREQMHERR